MNETRFQPGGWVRWRGVPHPLLKAISLLYLERWAQCIDAFEETALDDCEPAVMRVPGRNATRLAQALSVSCAQQQRLKAQDVLRMQF